MCERGFLELKPFPSTLRLFMLLLIPFSFGSTPLLVRFSVGVYASELYCFVVVVVVVVEGKPLPCSSLVATRRGGDDPRASLFIFFNSCFDFADTNFHQQFTVFLNTLKSQTSNTMDPKL